MNSQKFIGCWTIGVMQVSNEEREEIEKRFNEAVKEKDDWFYEIKTKAGRYFVADNGEMGYTAMLPEEY